MKIVNKTPRTQLNENEKALLSAVKVFGKIAISAELFESALFLHRLNLAVFDQNAQVLYALKESTADRLIRVLGRN